MARRQDARRRLDARLEKWREPASQPIPHQGWVRAIRDALGMSSTELAERLGVDQSRVPRIEQGEVKGSVTLDTMQRAAEAMGCRFVYAIVPDESLDASVMKQARAKARRELGPVEHTMDLEDQSTAGQGGLLEEMTEDWVDRRGLWS